MPDPAVRPVHRTRPFEPCLARRPCRRRHRWQAACPCGWRQTYRSQQAAEYGLFLFHPENCRGDADD